MFPALRILLAIDGSDASVEAVRSVRARPWPTGSTIRILSVVSPLIPMPPIEPWPVPLLGYDEIQDKRKREAERLVNRAAESIRRRDLATETVVRVGEPRSAIVELADQWRADLIVLGTRGHTGMKRWLLGSVAHHVVVHAPCSVEVVRRRPEDSLSGMPHL